MKKLIIELLQKYFDQIRENWVEKLLSDFGDRLTENQLRSFVENTINTIIEIIEKTDYSIADQYLIDIYNLFSQSSVNLLEISQFFTQGRYAIINFIENDESYQYDPVILLGFMDEIIEQIFARYGIMHQEATMKELASDRDRLATKLDINQQYLKNILHSSDSAIMVVDSHERFIAWNKGAEKIFGYTEDDVIGKTSSLLLPKEKKYFDELEKIKFETQENGFLQIPETERVTKDGRLVSVALNVSELPGKNGEYIGRSVVIKDFTEVKKLQQQVDQSEKLVVIGQLAAGVAHEIGNPLTSISSLVQVIQRKTKDEFVSEQLITIKENIDRISKIVRELVDFSRPPSFEKMIIDITDVVKTALGIVKYDKRVKKVDFKTEFADEIPKVDIVPDQVLQVFVNILINALDAVKGNGIITVKTYKDQDSVYVEIIDDGMGMDQQTLNKIFDPFFTTKEVGKGTGLGLSVSYGIVKKFHGDILVESETGTGSKFIVKLPVSKNQNGE